MCPVSKFRSLNPLSHRALALDPMSGILSTLINHQNHFAEVRATIGVRAGPPQNNNSAVILNRTNSDYLDGGLYSFATRSNGGFTAVVVAKFTGTAESYEPILFFGQRTFVSQNVPSRAIRIYRKPPNHLSFAINNDLGGYDCWISRTNAIVQDQWLCIVAQHPTIVWK